MNIGIDLSKRITNNSKNLFRLKCSFGTKPAPVLPVNQPTETNSLRSSITSDTSIIEMQKIVKENFF